MKESLLTQQKNSNMKTIILTLTLLTLLIPMRAVQAQTKTPTKTPKAEVTKESQTAIEKIKDAVASKVAELNLVEKRGIFGKVVETTSSQITIEDRQGNQHIIEIDELTKFEGEKQSDDFGISDIKEDSTLSAVGLYNKETEKLLARFITQKVSIPTSISGAITNVDEDEYTITVVDKEGTEYTIDIERSTDTLLYDKELSDSGFSKFEIGEKVIVTGLPSKEEDNRISAERVLHFKALPPTEEVKKHLSEQKSPSPTQAEAEKDN